MTDTDADIMDADAEDIIDAFGGVPDGSPKGYDPAAYYGSLIGLPHFAPLREAEGEIPVVMWMFRNTPHVRSGRQILGTCNLPRVQGSLAGFFQWMLREKFGVLPDYLVVLDRSYWNEATDRQREILVFHEMCHMALKLDKFGMPKIDRETMRPMFVIAGHDIEEFRAVASRYGAHDADVVAFVAAVAEGETLNQAF